jgi:DNA-binding MarR family transcriptional regulator
VRIIDEVVRLKGRLKTVFAGARAVTGLSPMETTVLAAVIEADSAPTVSQIARSLGHPRQVVQRAANKLMATKLLTAVDNPDHKRAPLLRATAAGEQLYGEAEAQARKAAESVARVVGLRECERLANDLHVLRSKIEAHLRSQASAARPARPRARRR